MSALPAGSKPELFSRVLVRGPWFVAALLVAGCAQTNSQYVQTPQVAGYVAEAAQIEGDGLPTQTPPTKRIRQMPADMAEPFSPNYGGTNPAAMAPGGAVREAESESAKPYVPQDLPEDFRRRLAAAVDTAG